MLYDARVPYVNQAELRFGELIIISYDGKRRDQNMLARRRCHCFLI